jgi:hypothetical protein
MPEHVDPFEPVDDIDFAEVFEVFEDERPDPLATEALVGFAGRGSAGGECHCSSSSY